MKTYKYWTSFIIFLIFYFSIQICAEQPIWIFGILLIICYNFFLSKSNKNYNNYNFYKIRIFLNKRIFFFNLEDEWHE